MSNRRYNQFYNTLHKMPCQLDCNFTVDQANGNGLGIRSLKGAGIESVFMNSTASFNGTINSTVNVTGIASGTSSLVVGMPVQGTNIPAGTTIASIVSSSAITLSQAATGSATEAITYQGVGSPNPQAGTIVVVFEDNFQYYIGGYSGFVAPLSGSSLAVDATNLTVGHPYVIVSLGTSTAADWVTLGVPIGTTPAVGLAFIAQATGAGSGSGMVQTPSSSYSGIDHIEVVGDANQSINSQIGAPLGASTGPYIVLQCLFEGALTQPAHNTVIAMNFLFQNSRITNQGY